MRSGALLHSQDGLTVDTPTYELLDWGSVTVLGAFAPVPNECHHVIAEVIFEPYGDQAFVHTCSIEADIDDETGDLITSEQAVETCLYEQQMPDPVRDAARDVLYGLEVELESNNLVQLNNGKANVDDIDH